MKFRAASLAHTTMGKLYDVIIAFRALLVRPDGVIAWMAEDHANPDVDAVKVALEQRFGFQLFEAWTAIKLKQYSA